MTTMNKFAVVIGVVGVLALGGCETMNNPSSTANSGSTNSGSVTPEYGVVQSIDLVQQGDTGSGGSGGIGGSGIGIGTVAGAIIGGVLGNQVGGGTGKTVATVAGAAGGAYVGHEIDNRQRQQKSADSYRFTIRMENGSYQTMTRSTSDGFRVGDRVRIANGTLQRY